MNMNTKGFTLIELIIAIAILSLLIIITTTSYNNISQRSKQKALDMLMTTIKLAAENYAADSGIKSFFVKELINKGYLDADVNGQLYNPINKKQSLTCYAINIKLIKGAYFAEITESNTCNNNLLKSTTLSASKNGNTVTLNVICTNGQTIIITSNRGFYNKGICTSNNIYSTSATFNQSPTTYNAAIRDITNDLINSDSIIIN